MKTGIPKIVHSLPLCWKVALAAAFLAITLILVIPAPHFKAPYATLLETAEGELLGARIASDGQWRFPPPDSIPYRFEKCLLMFEDQHFYAHPGINPVSMARAIIQNIRAGEIVSGGSTITMQLARLSRPGRPRTVLSKAIETAKAFFLEIRYSKHEILTQYVSHAPFGGNVVGLEAAAWRYFHRPPQLLSWAESATLAVLPNAPSLVFPGKNDNRLMQKRNRLLTKLAAKKVIDSLTLTLALEEPLPGRAFPIPSGCYHLLEHAIRENQGKRIQTTINPNLQQLVTDAVNSHSGQLSGNNIFNAAALVAETRTGRVIAYVGNSNGRPGEDHGNQVDIIRSRRSSGSILKPFLYAAMLDKGMLAPRQLIADIPTRFGGFTPLNFSRDYDGAVPASEALARSLNVPAVKMLQQYGVESFYLLLRKTGMSTLSQPPGHYGLSLILGGAETTLWDLAGMYASLAGIVTRYTENDGFYSVGPFRQLTWQPDDSRAEEAESTSPFLRASAAWLTLDALQKVVRPEEETGWEAFAGNRHIAWKTGTSFGFRDGWAVGVTPDHTVAVWTGNADGEGRPGLTGTATAAPLMFGIFALLPPSKPFQIPEDELVQVAFCRQSGYLPSPYCSELDSIKVPVGIRISQCPYHHLVHLDREGLKRVNSDCYPVSEMQSKSWFTLPPVQEYYYRRRHPGYAVMPPFRTGCQTEILPMELIYPREMNRIFIPRQLDGSTGEVLFELAHRQPEAEVYWFIDENFMGATKNYHQMSLRPAAGWHTLTLTDENGNQLRKRFMIVE